MIRRLKRHPMPMQAVLDDVLVLTYALPADRLEPWVPPGLALDTLRGYGFLALALVRARHMRPAGLGVPARLGMDPVLAGYRLFVRFRDRTGRTRRGLHILRSYTDSAVLAAVGNRLTHYRYRRAGVRFERIDDHLRVELRTPGGAGDLRASASLSPDEDALPDWLFRDGREARRFAGPLPYTFDYERGTGAIVMIKGERSSWDPHPVAAEVEENRFLQTLEVADTARLASAFHVSRTPYLWRRGEVAYPMAEDDQPADGAQTTEQAKAVSEIES